MLDRYAIQRERGKIHSLDTKNKRTAPSEKKKNLANNTEFEIDISLTIQNLTLI